MFQEPEHYTESDHFFFESHDDLETVCNAPKGKQGVFKIIELSKRKINLVYIGHSSQEGLFDAIVNGLHHDGKPRKDSLPQQLLIDKTDALDIYWYVIEPPLSPKAVESEMIEDYCYGGGKMPKWNR
jgi:hypothetical protein